MNRKKQFAVIGLGRFGRAVTKTLVESGFDVFCCDKSMAIVKEMEPFVTKVVQADVTHENAVAALGLNNFDVVIIAIGDSLESAVMATLYAKEAGVRHIIAKAQNLAEKKILEKIGADTVIMPEMDSGRRLAINLTTTNVIEYISFSDKYAMAEIKPLHEWVGLSIKEANIRAEYGFNIVAIKRNEDVLVSPVPQTIIKEDSMLVIIGENSKIQSFNS